MHKTYIILHLPRIVIWYHLMKEEVKLLFEQITLITKFYCSGRHMCTSIIIVVPPKIPQTLNPEFFIVHDDRLNLHHRIFRSHLMRTTPCPARALLGNDSQSRSRLRVDGIVCADESSLAHLILRVQDTFNMLPL